MSDFNWEYFFFISGPKNWGSVFNQWSLSFDEMWHKDIRQSRSITSCQRRKEPAGLWGVSQDQTLLGPGVPSLDTTRSGKSTAGRPQRRHGNPPSLTSMVPIGLGLAGCPQGGQSHSFVEAGATNGLWISSEQGRNEGWSQMLPTRRGSQGSPSGKGIWDDQAWRTQGTNT